MRPCLLSPLLVLLVCAGCARLNDLAQQARSYVPPVQRYVAVGEKAEADMQQQLDERQARIEQRAMNKEITWVQAAREVRSLHRRTSLNFDKLDEQYHVYSATLAEQVDAGRLTPAKYDTLRVQRLVEIQRQRDWQ